MRSSYFHADGILKQEASRIRPRLSRYFFPFFFHLQGSARFSRVTSAFVIPYRFSPRDPRLPFTFSARCRAATAERLFNLPAQPQRAARRTPVFVAHRAIKRGRFCHLPPALPLSHKPPFSPALFSFYFLLRYSCVLSIFFSFLPVFNSRVREEGNEIHYVLRGLILTACFRRNFSIIKRTTGLSVTTSFVPFFFSS